MTFILPSSQILITDEPSHSALWSWRSSAMASTWFLSSCEISEKLIGLFSPLKLAEVETMGLLSLEISFLQKSSFVRRIPMLPSSAKSSLGSPFGLS